MNIDKMIQEEMQSIISEEDIELKLSPQEAAWAADCCQYVARKYAKEGGRDFQAKWLKMLGNKIENLSGIHEELIREFSSGVYDIDGSENIEGAREMAVDQLRNKIKEAIDQAMVDLSDSENSDFFTDYELRTAFDAAVDDAKLGDLRKPYRTRSEDEVTNAIAE